MTPEERVGQLFLVTFKGSDPAPDDPVFDLIQDGHVSGILLTTENDNFVGAPDTLEATRALVERLQTEEYESSLEFLLQDPLSGEPRRPVYVPLFIALSQEGGGAPFATILGGLSEAPSEMAIGATWDPNMAEAVGEVLGRELKALGVNMILAPSLDVLEDPRQGVPGDLGVRAFGGDPFWISRLGMAYVRGLHKGAQDGLAVVAKHFPGLGSSNRPLGEEVATIRRSLEQLKQVDLAPFFAVTAKAPGEAQEAVDGLLTAHIRYQGFQGNIRTQTRPVSLDPTAMDALMGLEPLASWREAGGIIVSDSLGSRAVRRFYDPTEVTFKAHLVARDAFLAGNDLLILDDFRASDAADEYATIRETLAFFAQKYREDQVFAQRVDEAALRVIRTKLRLYGGAFLLSRVIPAEGGLSLIGNSPDVAFEVARNAATLISPPAEELAERLGDPPKLGQRVVFFTDLRLVRQCSTCAPQARIGLRALEETVLRLYGQRGAGQVGDWNLTSFSMADLAFYLGEAPSGVPETPLTQPEVLDDALRAADWLVFSTLRSDEDVYGSNALKLLLNRRPDLARGKRIVVFGHDVPYDLDATDISKIDAYYALYDASPSFVDVAARLLFQELTPTGAPPVSVPGIGYDLIKALSPDPSQVLRLRLGASGPEAERGLKVGDIVELETGPIVDHNGNVVPDGTPVQFRITRQGDTGPPVILEATTVEGMARASMTLDSQGVFAIRVEADPARVSDLIQLTVQESGPGSVAVIPPTSVPTVSVSPTSTTHVVTPTAERSGEAEESVKTGGDGVGLLGMTWGLLGLALVAGGEIWWARRKARSRSGVRPQLIVVVGGLLLFNYFSLGLPGSERVIDGLGALTGLLATMVGGLTALLVARLSRVL